MKAKGSEVSVLFDIHQNNIFVKAVQLNEEKVSLKTGINGVVVSVQIVIIILEHVVVIFDWVIPYPNHLNFTKKSII